MCFIECMSVQAMLNNLTLKFGFHVDIGKAPEDTQDLLIHLLRKESQHISPVRVLQTDKILQRPYLILKRDGPYLEDLKTVFA